VSYARGELVCFFDDDDYMFPNYLETFVRAFAEKPSVKMVRCDVAIVGSGAGGGTVAAALAPLVGAGKRVLVLERGPRFLELDFTGRELDMAPALYADEGASPFAGIAAMPPSLTPTFLALDLSGAFDLGLVTIVFIFLFVDLFDNTGTLIGVAHRAGLLDRDGSLPQAGRAFGVAAVSAMGGALLGTSTVTSYIESAAGVKAGGRTGLVGMTVAALLLLTLFFAPLAQSVPAYATAPALLFVACLMARGLAELDWEDSTEYAPAVVTALAMPLSFSIANGIALGFICYVAVKLLSGRPREAGSSMIMLALLFMGKYAFL